MAQDGRKRFFLCLIISCSKIAFGVSKPKNIDSGSPLNQEFLRVVSLLPTYKAFLDEWERGGGGGGMRRSESKRQLL